MKKVMCLILTAMLALSSVSVVFAEDKAAVTLNGERLECEAQVKNGLAFAPLRGVCEAMGLEVSWDGEKRAVGISGASVNAEVVIGKAEIKNNGMTVSLDAAPYIDGGKTYIAAEALNSLGASAEFDGEALAVTVDKFDGKYFKIVQASTGKVFSLENGRLNDNVRIAMEAAADTDLQVWKFSSRGEGRYNPTNKKSRRSFDIPNGRKDLGLNLIQYGITEGTNQWIVPVENGDGTYLLLCSHTDDLYLTVTEEGIVVQDELKKDETQLFRLEEVKVKAEEKAAAETNGEQSDSDEEEFVLETKPHADSVDDYEKDQIGGKYYKITEALTGKAVGVENGSADDSARIVAEEAAESDSQLWAFVTQGSGMYTVTNKQSGRAFDIPAGSKDEKAALTQYSVNYGDNQIFELMDGGNGTVMLKNKNSGLYLTVDGGYLNQQALGRSNNQSFVMTEAGDCADKMIGAAATLFLLKGEDTVSNAKVQWNNVIGATDYDVYRSVDGGDYEFLISLSGNCVDDYDLEIGKSYSYAVYALENGSLIDWVETKAVEPYELPADLTPASNLEESSIRTPNSMVIDGVYYRYSAWGRDDGGSGFGRLMMSTSTDDITYTEPVEVLNYKDILAHETCKDFTSCRFESQNIVYNPAANKVVFIAHFEADGGYGTARTSIASGTPGEYFTFHGAVRPEDDDTRDLNVYVDDDNCAYIMAAVHNNADLALYKLNDDWSEIERRVCYVNRGKWRELPNMLKVDGIYYLFTSGTAGWYPTQGGYNTAASIEGPWSPLKTVGNTNTFSAQSGYVSRLNKNGENYLMNAYRWMYFWSDAVSKRTVNRRYPISVSNGYAFYDFFDELLYNWENDDLVPVQNGRLLSQGMPAKAEVAVYGAVDGAEKVNDGNYYSYWYGGSDDEEVDDTQLWPFTWEVDLGKARELSEIQISWLIWNGSEPYYSYKVEGSVDGKAYTEILDNTEGYTDYGFTVDELSGRARYVRLTVTNAKPRSSEENIYPPQLYEVKVLGR